MCGEQAYVTIDIYIQGGSPPRVRGTVAGALHQLHFRGITPACAGNRGMRCLPRSHIGDHPRVCGEQYPAGGCGGRRLGSPPRVRGTGHKGSSTFVYAGITPACAGNRREQKPMGKFWEDHPRVCGEQFALSMDPSDSSGSPPRVRGTVIRPHVWVYKPGITPACAGNSTNPKFFYCITEDHPRVCGEQLHRINRPCCLIGSPPRVRGTG